jgi:hypothetical protein
MSHWLEEAEKKQDPQKETISRADRIKKRYLRIQENLKNNGNQFDEFTNDLQTLINRVNKLPANKNRPFRKMEGREKESKLNSHLNIFSSTRQINDQKFWDFLPFFNSNHFKHIRVLYINISAREGMCEIELKENLLKRETLISDKTNQKMKSSKSGKFHVIYTFPVSHLDHELALEIIDWLAFSKEISDCSFYNTVNEEAKHFFK